jgi:uncharacterized membrane protein YozB (DUF420 family)
MSLADLPAVNATLNALSAVLLGMGYYHIRRGRQRAHRTCMVAAFLTSTLFLACYLTYHIYLAHVLMYVSVTGVLIYLLLYEIFPQN